MPHLYWLEPEQTPGFPDTQFALDEPDGLLAVGGKLTSPWLLEAYQNGIFPWFSQGEPIMWWSPSPRMVLKPGYAHVSRTLKKQYRRNPVQITRNRCFETVIDHCSDPSHRRDDGTWITDEMKQAYIALHQEGWAHSIEVWDANKLIGGLYGLGIENMFFGESMFSLQPSSSKFAFLALSEWLASSDGHLIDCQLYNDYLASLGAQLITRTEFERHLPKNVVHLSATNQLDLTELIDEKLR